MSEAPEAGKEQKADNTPAAKGAAEKSAAKDAAKKDAKAAPQKGKPHPKAEPKKPASSGGGGGSLLASLALLIALGAAGGGYYLWQQFNSAQQADQQALTRLDSRMDGVGHDTQESITALEKRLAAMQNSIETVNTLLGREQNEWLVAEAAYLLRIAAQRLALDRDVAGALAALQAADASLRDTGAMKWQPVRDAIGVQQAALRAVELPDVAGLSASISGLVSEATKLPQIQPKPETLPTMDAAEEESPEQVGWQRWLSGVWEALRSLVVIRHTDKPVMPLLAPDQAQYLRQNLVLQLETARYALLRGEVAVYRSSLENAKQWVSTYFDAEAPAAHGFIQGVDSLLAVNIYPALPDISAPLSLLERVRKGGVVPQPPKPKAAPAEGAAS